MASITSWLRLEPLPRQQSMERGLQAQVRDPLWMLARQWMMGEFMALDGGSPVQGTLSVESQTLTAYQPGAPGTSAAVDFDPSLPLEAHVERESFTLGLRESVQLGQYFEKLARQAGATNADIGLYRQAFAIPASAADEIQDRAARAFRSAVSSRAINGMKLYPAIRNAQALPATSVSLSGVAATFADYCAKLYSLPEHDSAWNSRQLLFRFSVVSDPGQAPVTLSAPDFRGDRVDWYSLDPSSTAVASQQKKPTTFETFNFLPTHVHFRGMPKPRWWQFEDAQTDFGALELENVDLAKMLIAEFGLIYSHDWFLVPVPLRVGTLSRVDALVVTDTFGYRTLIQPADQSAVPGAPAWSVFQLCNGQTRLNSLFIPPTLGTVQDGPAVERVLFIRDEMAEMAWGIEKKILGPMDSGVDGHEAWRLRLQDEGPLDPPLNTPGTDIYYLFQTTVPDYWIPLVPIQSLKRGRYFRRGIIQRPSRTGEVPIKARTTILEPEKPYFVHDHAVPRSGMDVTRYFRRSRWVDGSTIVWMARRVRPGRGPGWSGLAYDLIVPEGKTPTEISS